MRADGLTGAARFELLEPLGAGGMGEVRRARDLVLRRDVAIKRILPPTAVPGAPGGDPALARRLAMREARAAARINNPHAVRVYDVVDLGGWPCVVMEYVASRSLREIIDDDGPLPPHSVAAIGLAILDALTAAHRVGVLHRDVKPGNILVARSSRVVLTDFGIATRTMGVVDGDAQIVATPAYVPPERLVAGLSLPSGDLWSLGASLYTAVEGRPPYERISPDATIAAVATLPPDPTRRAGPLRRVLEGLLDRDPAARPVPAQARTLLRAVVREARVAVPPVPGRDVHRLASKVWIRPVEVTHRSARLDTLDATSHAPVARAAPATTSMT